VAIAPIRNAALRSMLDSFPLRKYSHESGCDAPGLGKIALRGAR
jgi:hypothetical protein